MWLVLGLTQAGDWFFGSVMGLGVLGLLYGASLVYGYAGTTLFSGIITTAQKRDVVDGATMQAAIASMTMTNAAGAAQGAHRGGGQPHAGHGARRRHAQVKNEEEKGEEEALMCIPVR